MSELWKKIRGSWINSIIFSCLLLFIFLFFFYLANLDLGSSSQKLSESKSLLQLNAEAELQKKIGAGKISVSGYQQWIEGYTTDSSKNRYDDDPDGEGLPNYLEYAYGTNPLKSDTDGDGFSDKQEIKNGYDPDAPGDIKPRVEVVISKIGVVVPMVWSASETEDSQLKDLENGVVHFPQTASPGQAGKTIISGHSSNYIWAKGNYNHIFKDLNNLEIGDKINIKTIQQNGRIFDYRYSVKEKNIVSPDDPKIFEDTPNSTLMLSTCWPLGTTLRRLIVSAELDKN